jgi:threonine dehydrogenase-like Zn-dependent dehydrogenase
MLSSRLRACAICGSDLHIYGGIIPAMKKGDVLGHENMGEVIEVGPGNKALKVGDRVVVPFTIACGECFFCRNGFYSGCERTNPDHEKAAKLWGNSPAGLFGYSRLLGGYAGGQAEYLRVPYADVGPIKVPGNLSDEQVLFLSDIFPTGYMAADFCKLKGGETVAIWGCGPVGQFAIRSAFTVSVVGVYGGFLDKVPMGSAINRGLTFRMAQTPVQHYLPKLLKRIENGDIDPSFVITHTAPLEKGPELYKTFRDKKDGCIKVVLKPAMKEPARA